MRKLLPFAIVLLSALATNGQKYKIGDTHPCGGIVFSVDATGTKGFIAASKDAGHLTYAEAVAPNAMGQGWKLPNNKLLKEMYTNLAKKKLGGFKPELYRSSESGYASYPWALHFGTGKEETSALNNKTLCRAVKEFPCNNTPTPKPAPQQPKQSVLLNAGGSLNAGAQLKSANGAFILKIQDDGNLCVYPMTNGQQSIMPKWCSNASGFKNAKLQLKVDGNLVVVDGSNTIKWQSNTNKDANNKPVKLVLENDGRLVLYSGTGKAVWTNK
ncbi:MAG: hypothetical protein IPH58_13840 [Sphingobacteriales bacterium]|jgi:hypothetical protein|nr:hypothetical protein [Sphingobacteriales bacterium]